MSSVKFERLVFRLHALLRMRERGLTVAEVVEALARAEVLEEYPSDSPLPSKLVLGRAWGRALHVVVAEAEEGKVGVVITAYEPDPDRWDGELRRRRR